MKDSEGIIHLREWGTDKVYPLPSSEISITINQIRVERFDYTKWMIVDPVMINGESPTSNQCLRAGDTIEIEGMVLVAENKAIKSLYEFLLRVFGWTPEARIKADHALHKIFLSVTNPYPLILNGKESLLEVARSIAERLYPNKPFVTCDPHRRDYEGDVRSGLNRSLVADAIKRVKANGFICFHLYRAPEDLNILHKTLLNPATHIHTIILSDKYQYTCITPWITNIIDIPALNSRRGDIPKLINEYTADAVCLLKQVIEVSLVDLTEAAKNWIENKSANSLTSIRKGTLRLLAIRNTRSVSSAARVLRMAPVSLQRWLDRRENRDGDD